MLVCCWCAPQRRLQDVEGAVHPVVAGLAVAQYFAEVGAEDQVDRHVGVEVGSEEPALGVGGDCFLQGRMEETGRSMEEVTERALANQSVKRFIDPDDVAALVPVSSDAHRLSAVPTCEGAGRRRALCTRLSGDIGYVFSAEWPCGARRQP